jgi:hypothetical protein
MTAAPPALLDSLRQSDRPAAERALAAGETPVGWQSLSHRVCLEEVVRTHATTDQPKKQGRQRLDVQVRDGREALGDRGEAALWRYQPSITRAATPCTASVRS